MMALPPFLMYNVKAGITLAVLYLFYRVFLVQLTFYKSNRYYLMGFICLSLLAPLVNTDGFWPSPVSHYTSALENLTPLSTLDKAAPLPAALLTHPIAHASIPTHWIGGQWMVFLLLIGMAVMGIRLLIQWLSLVSIKRHATEMTGRTPRDIHMYAIATPTGPFSFGRNIFVHPASHTKDDLDRIVAHETIHIREGHSLDLWLAQGLLILQWWNPVAWMMDRSVRQNLEYVADDSVLRQGTDRRQYQYLLLKVSGIPSPFLAQPFHFSPVKNRIAMMNKQPSGRVQTIRFLFALPLLLFLLAAFSSHRAEKGIGAFHEYVGFVVDAKTLAPIEGVAVLEKFSGFTAVTNEKGYFRMHIPLPVSSNTCIIQATFTKPGLDTGTSHLSFAVPYSNKAADDDAVTLEFIGMSPSAFPNRRFVHARSLSGNEAQAFLRNDTAELMTSYQTWVTKTLGARVAEDVMRDSDKIYFEINGNSYVSLGGGYASQDTIDDLILVDGKTLMTGEALNQHFQRNQFMRKEAALDATTALKMYGVNKTVFVLWLKKPGT